MSEDLGMKKVSARWLPRMLTVWFQSYLSSRKQYVRRGSNISSVTYLVCGLGPILFVLYTVDLLGVIDSYGLSAYMCTPTIHRFADSVDRPR